jgi:antitoxin component YwqK of YwqJK toxin-antitoxin module
MMDGFYREYYEDGKTLKTEGTYKKDNKVGVWKEYDKTGKVIKTEKFK